MTDDSPFPFVWTDAGVMAPINPYWAKRADERWVVGENYRLIEHQERSQKSHSHYFAAIHESWMSLPERFGDMHFATSEHLRKYALIKAGFKTERIFVCASKAEALRLAAFVKPMDDFAVVVVTEATVSVYTAKSQSTRAMGRAEFQKSKQAVLDVIDGLLQTRAA